MSTCASSMPEAGGKAPAFSAMDSQGKKVKLSDFKGKAVVLYFYPKDDTPGCTVEAVAFQKHLEDFKKAGAVVIGVSPDDATSHCKFAGKYNLGFSLLCDTEHEVAQRYGVWVEKSMYGKKHWGIQRATFLIDGSGTLVRVWPKVKPEGHAEEVLEAVRAL